MSTKAVAKFVGCSESWARRVKQRNYSLELAHRILEVLSQIEALLANDPEVPSAPCNYDSSTATGLQRAGLAIVGPHEQI
jgi:hypothetical protein